MNPISGILSRSQSTIERLQKQENRSLQEYKKAADNLTNNVIKTAVRRYGFSKNEKMIETMSKNLVNSYFNTEKSKDKYRAVIAKIFNRVDDRGKDSIMNAAYKQMASDNYVDAALLLKTLFGQASVEKQEKALMNEKDPANIILRNWAYTDTRICQPSFPRVKTLKPSCSMPAMKTETRIILNKVLRNTRVS